MEKQCPQCGAERPSGAEWEQEVCPACLMKLGLSGAIPAFSVSESDPEAGSEPQPKGVSESKPEVRQRWLKAPRWNWRWLARGVEGAVLIALITLAALHFAERPSPQPPIRMVIDAPGDAEVQDLSISPDGHALAYTATSRGDSMLWIRRLDILEPRGLPGSEGASMPFWSPDSRSIGFFTGGKLKTIRVDGGPPLTIADAPQPHGGSWNSEGAILFASNGGLRRVRSGGGEAVPVKSIESSRGFVPRWPQFLPDGRHFLFTAMTRESRDGIYLGDLASSQVRLLIQGGSGGVYSDGRILFVKDGILMVQHFDAHRLELTGDAVPLAEYVSSRVDRGLTYSAGADILTFRTGGASVAQSLVWMDVNGKIMQAAGERIEEEGFALSPGLDAIAMARTPSGARESDLWLLNLSRGAVTRMTFDARGVTSPLWTPDGKRVAFIAPSPGEIRAVAVNDSRSPETILKLEDSAVLDAWSPDQRLLLYTAAVDGRLSIWMLPIEQGGRKPSTFLRGDFNYEQAKFSPDGRWVAYVSDESGRDEVYVRAFPSGEDRAMISVEGGTRPSWRRDGRELFYVSPQRELMAVDVGLESSRLRVGRPIPLFRMPSDADAYEVGDGRRFLIAVSREEQQRSPINVVLHWTSER